MEQLTKEQIKCLDKVCNGKWEQTEKGIYVDGDVNMSFLNIKYIPVKFYKVKGDFSCCFNNLTNLEGCPEYVGCDLNCSNNNLINLEGCPEYVGRYFFCDYNKLMSLEGIGEVIGIIYCNNNKISYKKEKELRPEIYKKINISILEKMLAES